MKAPTTSTTLLKCLGDAQSARWGDFVERYEPSMRAFLATHFPSVPADDSWCGRGSGGTRHRDRGLVVERRSVFRTGCRH